MYLQTLNALNRLIFVCCDKLEVCKYIQLLTVYI